MPDFVFKGNDVNCLLKLKLPFLLIHCHYVLYPVKKKKSDVATTVKLSFVSLLPYLNLNNAVMLFLHLSARFNDV